MGRTLRLLAVVLCSANLCFSQMAAVVSSGRFGLPIATGDSRIILQPSYPTVCSTFYATKYLASTTTININPYNSTCSPAGTLGCTGGTSMEPSNTSPGYAQDESQDNSAFTAAMAACPAGQAVEVAMDGSGHNAIVLGPWTQTSKIIIDAGVSIEGSRTPTDYGSTCGIVTTGSSNCTPWITVTAANMGIYGPGRLNGRAWAAYPSSATQSFNVNKLQSQCNSNGGTNHGRPACTPNSSGTVSNGPKALFLSGANGYEMYGVMVQDAGQFSIHVKDTTGAVFWNVNVINGGFVNFSDGFDPEGSSSITWFGGNISVGDNRSAIKAGTSGSSNITISHTQGGCGIGYVIGSDTQNGVKNILYDTITTHGCILAADNTAWEDQSEGFGIGSSTANGGSVDTVTRQYLCLDAEGKTFRDYTNYNGSTGTHTPIYTNIVDRDWHVLADALGNSGTFTFQGLSGFPILMQQDNGVIDGINQGIQSQGTATKDQYLTAYLGPRQTPTSITNTQFGAGTGISRIGTGTGGTTFACTSTTYQPLLGQLVVNDYHTSLSGAAPFTLKAVLTPAKEVSTKEATAPTASVQFLDNGSPIGSPVALVGDGLYYASYTVSTATSGSHLYTVSYPGDAKYSAYTWGNVTVTVP